ncbi:tRNA pseudouridine(13) synthase TruD [Thermovibrio sp.]
MRIKSSPSDFKVKEILKEPLKSNGKFKYFLLKKRGLETLQALKEVRKRWKVGKGELLYGGLKDKHGETWQYIAVPKEIKAEDFHLKNMSVVFKGFHDLTPRELLKSNLFEIKVYGVSLPEERRIKVLKERGIPNYYGEQRFTPVREGKIPFVYYREPKEFIRLLFKPAGWENSRSRKGKKLFLKGEFKEALPSLKGWRREVAAYLLKGGDFKGALKLIPKEELEFQANVLQSFLFNSLLSRLIKESGAKSLKFKYKLGSLLYPLEEVNLPESLPVFTPDVELYDSILEELGTKREEFRELSPFFHSFKRKTAVKPEGFMLREFEGGCNLTFSLPKGAYATNLLRFLFSAVV